MNITGSLLRETTEKIINEGRKGAQFKINELTTPRQLLDKLPADALEKFGAILQYRGIYSADYTVKFSALWSTLFWKIGEQILKVGSYQSPFDRFGNLSKSAATLKNMPHESKTALTVKGFPIRLFYRIILQNMIVFSIASTN